ncbi:hypothetical protein K1F50_14145 [Muricauda oceani]|uniref:Lipoprotein n=1 Tax=Flagellimonas oceani TaxID=2698672 RepID=A0A6G7J2D0_9FLAO|nr:hypothetical protein [Allomuricauda oceani]MBW8243945.1 hypothetical protein [Allomuricauda oceani]QII44926.1 hypothetical protein GVT53_09605 [Allomuricauda oceani]
MKNILSCLVVLAVFLSCSDERKFVNLALKIDQKIYLVPFFANQSILENQLSEDVTPSVTSFVQIIEEDGTFFVEPRNFEKILNLIADNYVIYEKKEKTHDGYLAFGNNDIYNHSIQNVNTDKIGQQINQEVVRIFNNAQDRSLEIVWTRFPRPVAEKNCVVKNVWVVSSPYQGTTIGNYEETVLIDLNDIVDFFDNGTRLTYNEREGILYVIK